MTSSSTSRRRSSRSCRACSRSAASGSRAWCETSGGASWTPAGGSSGASSFLTAAESIITYRFRYRSQAQLETLLDLLLLDSGNPRSLAYQLDRLTDDLDALPIPTERRLREEQRLVLEASTALRLADPASLVIEQDDGRRPALDAFLAHLQDRLLRAADAVDSSHFTHLVPVFSLVGPAGTEPSIGRAA